MSEPTPVQAEIIQKIIEERSRQDKKFGEMPTNCAPSLYLTVLTEETGEVARAIRKGKGEDYVKGLIQVAAVAMCAIEDCRTGRSLREVSDVCKKIQYKGDRRFSLWG